MLVVKFVAVVAGPMPVVSGILVEPLEPREAVLGVFVEVSAPMVADVEILFFVVVPRGLGPAAALVLEAVPKLAAFAAVGAAHETVSRVAEPVVEAEVDPEIETWVAELMVVEVMSRMGELVPGLVLALQADSRLAAFEGSTW